MSLGSIQQKIVDFILSRDGVCGIFGILNSDNLSNLRTDHVTRALNGLVSRKILELNSKNEYCIPSFIQNTVTTKAVETKTEKVLPKKTLLIGISRDHSGSMGGLKFHARNMFNLELAVLKQTSRVNDINTIATVIKSGVGINGIVEIESVNVNIDSVKNLVDYDASGYKTPLYDGVGSLIEILKSYPHIDENTTFLVSVITDGLDNNSPKWKSTIGKTISELQATGKWTFVFRVPENAVNLIHKVGVPKGNIFVWDQTPEGIAKSSIATQESLAAFYADTARGVTSTKSFYTTNLNTTNIQTVKAKLQDITDEIKLIYVFADDNGAQIRTYAEKYLGSTYQKGTIFYNLTKNEEVQDYKLIVIINKKTGKAYAGQSARDVLGIPYVGTIKLHPGNHGNYNIFIQSTSYNRKLVGGAHILHWANAC